MNPGDKGGESEVQKMRLVTRNEMEMEVGRCCQGQIPTMIEIRQRILENVLYIWESKLVFIKLKHFISHFCGGTISPRFLANALQRLQRKKVLLSPFAMGHSVTGRENLN